MLKKVALLILILFLVTTVTSSMPQPQVVISIGGDWTFDISAFGQKIEAAMTIIQDGENIKVVIKNNSGGERGGTGCVKGNDIEWTEIGRNSGRESMIVYKGKIENNTITGYAFPKDNESDRMEWKAVRKR
jgi:hypothetical protein